MKPNALNINLTGFDLRLDAYGESTSVPNGTADTYYLLIGIAQQWGYGTAGIITYPIQFTEIAYTAFACDIAESNNNIVSVATNPPEINQIVVRPSAAKTITWLVIGKQQWGYFYESQSDTDYRHFPVAFTTFLLPVLGKAYYLTTEPDGYVPYIEYLGSNNFLCGFGNNRIGNAYVPIMVIGKQQWGLTEEAYLPTIDFPVAFTSVPAVVGTPIKDYATSENYFGNNSIESVTVSSFVPRQTNTSGGTKAGAIRYIAVGY